MSGINYVELKAELLAGHSVTGAYSVDDATAAAEISAPNISKVKGVMTGAEMFAATVPADFAGLTAAKKSEWLSFCGIENHNPENNGTAHLFVQYIFGTSDTLTALAIARRDLISRVAEMGFGRNELTADHIAHARSV